MKTLFQRSIHMSRYRIESLLSARQFVHPQVVGDRLYFISDLSGRLSLYVMDVRGSVPEPLLPPDIALPNPHHLDGGVAFEVLPRLGQILLMLDRDGDENYQPCSCPSRAASRSRCSATALPASRSSAPSATRSAC